MPIYYINKKTGKIEAKYTNCETMSTLFRNTELYERRETKEDLPLQTKVAVTVTPKKKPQYKSLVSKVKDYVKRRLHLS